VRSEGDQFDDFVQIVEKNVLTTVRLNQGSQSNPIQQNVYSRVTQQRLVSPLHLSVKMTVVKIRAMASIGPVEQSRRPLRRGAYVYDVPHSSIG
jgi:hypothetical protein